MTKDPLEIAVLALADFLKNFPDKIAVGKFSEVLHDGPHGLHGVFKF